MSEKLKKKKKQDEVNQKLDMIIGIVVGILAVAVIVLFGIVIFSSLNQTTEPLAENTQNQTENGVTTPDDAKMNEKLTALASETAKQVIMTTNKGEVKMNVYPELMPITVDNFVNLIKANFYNGLTFHRVEDWVVQGGDPTGTGAGGSEKTIELETNEKLSNVRGALAMARSNDPNSASSQFYVVKKDTTGIDGQYAVFGMVTEGMNIIDSLAIGDTITSITVSE